MSETAMMVAAAAIAVGALAFGRGIAVHGLRKLFSKKFRRTLDTEAGDVIQCGAKS